MKRISETVELKNDPSKSPYPTTVDKYYGYTSERKAMYRLQRSNIERTTAKKPWFFNWKIYEYCDYISARQSFVCKPSTCPRLELISVNEQPFSYVTTLSLSSSKIMVSTMLNPVSI